MRSEARELRAQSKATLASLQLTNQNWCSCIGPMTIVQRVAFLASAASARHFSIASRLSRCMSAASTNACHACGLSVRISLMPASHCEGASSIRVAIRSGQRQLSGVARAMAPGRNDHR